MKIRENENLKRVALVIILGIVTLRVLPSLADTNTPDPAPTDSASSVSTPSPSSVVPAPTPSESLVTPSADPLISSSPEATATPSAAPTSIPGAVVISHIPSVLRVDPRAQSVAVSPIYIASNNSTLVCVTSYQASIDLPSAPSDLLVNQTSGTNLLISGNSSSITAALANLRLIGKVSSSAVAFQIVAVTAPTLNGSLCGDANVVRQVSVTAFGLQQNLVKVPLSMAKKR